MWLLVRNDGWFVADTRQTGGASYTTNILRARRFGTRSAAEADKCGNESVRHLHDFFMGVDLYA